MASQLDTVKLKCDAGVMNVHPPQNLRETLILAGIDLLHEGGLAGLTLRRAAARAGVSHAAPAHHFNGLPGLMTAIAARAFQSFADRMEQERVKAAPEPFSRLLAICHGYLAFAADHAALFQVMFNYPSLDRSDLTLLAQSERAYRILRDACQPFADDSAADAALETAVWSLVHGYALLGFGDPIKRSRSFVVAPGFETLLPRLIVQHANPLAPPANLR